MSDTAKAADVYILTMYRREESVTLGVFSSQEKARARALDEHGERADPIWRTPVGGRWVWQPPGRVSFEVELHEVDEE